MRRFLVVLEVIDRGEPDKDGAALYTLRSASAAGRYVGNTINTFSNISKTSGDEGVSATVKLTEEMLP